LSDPDALSGLPEDTGLHEKNGSSVMTNISSCEASFGSLPARSDVAGRRARDNGGFRDMIAAFESADLNAPH
jgi:hypothetical protein